MFYKIAFVICFALLFAGMIIIYCREQDRMVEKARYNHLQEYNKRLCSRLDEIEKENNELYSQNYKFENENKRLNDENLKLKICAQIIVNNNEKKFEVCPICGYKVIKNDKSDDTMPT